jgi:PEP-CTERM motif
MIRITVLPESMKRILQVVLLTGALATVGSASNVTTLTLNPTDGALQGQPGQSVGWGFTIQDDTFWVTVVKTAFCSTFSGGLPCDPVSNGTYMDFTPFNFVDSQPSSMGGPDTSQQTFDALSNLGTGSFTIAASTPIGAFMSGTIVIDYNLYDGDPTNGGVPQGGENFMTKMGSVLVVPIPEPGTLLLMGTALAGVWLLRRRASAHS